MIGWKFASLWTVIFLIAHSSLLWGQTRTQDIGTSLGPGVIANEGEIQSLLETTEWFSGLGYDYNSSRFLVVNALYHEHPDEIGMTLINPFAAFDLGLVRDIRSPLGELDQLLRSRTLTRIIGGSRVRPDQSQRKVPVRIRPISDGRAIAVGWGELRSYQDERASLVQLQQKGNLPTGQSGDHSDGQLDVIEAFEQLVIGEILHRQGLLATRGLIAGVIQNRYRVLSNGSKDTSQAGYTWRIHNLPRRFYFDRLNDPELDRNYFQQEIKWLNWSYPLIGGDLDSTSTMNKAFLITTINEALLKDLWALHGSYSAGMNQSPAVIDYGTFSFLHEPNLNARWKSNTYESELSAGLSDYYDPIRPQVIQLGSNEASLLLSDVFLSTLTFQRLLRFGFTQEQVIRHFEKRTLGRKDGQSESAYFYQATDDLIAFQKKVLELESMTYLPESIGGYTPDFSDPAYNAQQEHRSVINTRELGFQIVQRGALTQSDLNLAAVDELIDASLFPHVNRNELNSPRIEAMRNAITIIHGSLRKQFASEIHSDYSGIQERNAAYPRGQNMPSRYELRQEIYGWLNHPEGDYTNDFIDLVTRFDPPHTRDAMYAHYSRPPGHPFGLLETKFASAYQCPALFR